MRGGRYQSPAVKQDLAKLDKSPEVRRSALLSLKACVEQLDQASMPRFLAQVSDARDLNDSRSYAISLYEDVARVHGKLIAPHIPRIMATVVRSLSSSGSSLHLQEACSKVASSILRYSICPDTPASQVQAVFQDLCTPLLDSLQSKLQPLSTGAALCLQTLVESEKWKYAPESLVAELRTKSTLGLKDRPGQTVAHMQLARSLTRTDAARAEPELVRAAKELLQMAPTWQHKCCALQLLRASIAGLDRESLGADMAPLEHLLEQLRLDKMPHVRKEAVKTAQALRLVASGGSSKAELLQEVSFTSSSSRRFYCAEVSASSDSDTSNAAKAEEDEEEENKNCSATVNRYRGDYRLTPMPKQESCSADAESPSLSSSGQSEAVLTAEDFARFTTPRRLVRSLQLQVASPERMLSSDPCYDEEAHSETGWSVRVNPIAEDQDSDHQSSAVPLEESKVAEVRTEDTASWKGRVCKVVEGMLGACACLALLLPLAMLVMQLLLEPARGGGRERDLHVCLVPT